MGGDPRAKDIPMRLHLALAVALAALVAAAAPAAARAHAAGHPESYRVLTYNVAGIDVPGGLYPLDDEYETNVSMSDRADQISEYVKAGGYDIVALNEVFDNPPPKGHMRDDFIDDLSPFYPFVVEIFEGDESDDVLDSGLMLFSKFPFVPVSIPADGECYEYSGLKCLVAFHEYEAQQDEDHFAAKGIGFVRVQNPRTEGETNVFFTHMQASGTEFTWGTCGGSGDGCTIAARAKQIEEARQFVETWSSRWDTTRDTLLMGDLNVRHQNEDGTDTAEYGKQIAASANGVGLDETGLRDVWAETSPKDPVSSKWPSPNNKLDTILYRPPYVKGDSTGAMCATQHQTLERHFVYSELTDDGPVEINASDHYPYAAVIGRAGPLCSPLLALPNPPDGTLPLAITHPGSYQWLHFPKGGTYGFGIASPVTMELTAYAETDLSTPLQAFLGDGVVTGGGRRPTEKVVWTPAVGFYLRVRVADGANPNWTGGYSLLVNKHDGTSPAEAIQLDPWRPYVADQMSPAVQNPVGTVWFWVKTDTLDSGNQQRLHFETNGHPNLKLRMRLINKAQFDANPQQGGLISSGSFTTPKATLDSPLPNDPNQVSPVPAKGDLYYLVVEKEVDPAYPSGIFEVWWSTNLFYVDLKRLEVVDEDDNVGDDEPEVVADVDGLTHWQQFGSMDEDDPGHNFTDPALVHARAGTHVDFHVYNNDIDDEDAIPNGCLQAPSSCADLGWRDIAPTNTNPDATHLGIDLDPVDREIVPHFVNAADDDGEYVVYYRAYARIDQ
jgi:Endonuclease/Exonuclease/phosphatase family